MEDLTVLPPNRPPRPDAANDLSMSGLDTRAPSDEWRIGYVGGWAPSAALAPRLAVANGFLGVVGASPAAAAPETWVAGLFTDGPDVVQTLTPLPKTGCLSITIDGAPFPPAGSDSSFWHELDLRGGALSSRWLAQDRAGALADVTCRRIASLADRHVSLSLTRLTFRAGADVEVARLPREIESPLQSLRQADVEAWRSPGGRCVFARAAQLVLEPSQGELIERRKAPKGWRWRAEPGASLILVELHAVVGGEDVEVAAHEAQARLAGCDWCAVLADHEAAWADRWRVCDVEIDGDDAAQQALRFAAYHLVSAANPHDPTVSVGARGLTGPTYAGHVFWDTEIYLLPFYIHTWPDAARAMLLYRYRTLDAARAKASRLGWRGAFYAWESAESGDEAAPTAATGLDGEKVQILSGRDETHISADVAYAVWRYWRVTGDDAFFTTAGAEILLETARFWASRAREEAGGKRHIRDVEGPDEYHQNVDDNAFTNAMARWNLLRGVEAAETLRERWSSRWEDLKRKIGLNEAELEEWREAAEAMERGFDPKSGLYEQFAGYFGLEEIDPRPFAKEPKPIDVILGPKRIEASKVIKQADVVEMLALLEDIPPDVIAANFDYYEPRCANGSSLSLVSHALVAARLGRTEQALSMIHGALAVDLGLPGESGAGGVRLATLGGLWQVVVYGFAGLSERDGRLALAPKPPSGWKRLCFRLRWLGRLLQVEIRGPAVRVSLEAGEALEIAVGGFPRRVDRDAPITFDIERTDDE